MNIASYDEIAEWYDEFVRRDAFPGGIALLGVFELLGNVHGKNICDLACGQGIVARQLAQQGSQVTGVDISTKLLELARREEMAEPRGIVYVQDDAQSLNSLVDASFDMVLCNLALMDIPNIGAVF